MYDELQKMLKGLSHDELTKLLDNTAIITDSLGQELIKKAAGPNSPIAIDELDDISNGQRDEVLHRLYELEALGIFESAFINHKGGMTKQFAVTEFGRNTVLTSR